jgi:NitT/TauT family transport system ATP-binding protein
VPRPRSPAQWDGAEFQATKARLQALISPAEPAAADEFDSPDCQQLSMIRMTDVKDSVE